MEYVSVSGPPDFEKQFSIFCIVSNFEKFELLHLSLTNCGFSKENSELLIIDNSVKNCFGAYRGIRMMNAASRGRYRIFVHDDVEFLDDDADKMLSVLKGLDELDPNWVICGNAGGRSGIRGWRGLDRHLVDPHGDSKVNGPIRVKSLDENFLILNSLNLVLPSLDTDGFHLYATDVCILAGLAGGSAYVVPFRVRHHSGGNLRDRWGERARAFHKAREALEAKYTARFRGDVVQTPSCRLYLGAYGKRMRVYESIEGYARRLVTGALRRLGSLVATDKKHPH